MRIPAILHEITRIALAGTVVLLGSGVATAPAEPLVNERVWVGLEAFATDRAGPTPREGGLIEVPVKVGESTSLVVGAGSFDRNGRAQPGFCGGSFSSNDFSAHEIETGEKAPHAWVAEVKVLDATMDSLTLQVEWAHYVSAARGSATRVRGDTRVLSLREGDRHVLDFEDEGEIAGDCPTRSVLVDVKARVAEDPALAGARLAYDLWIVDEAPGGARQTRRLDLAAAQGESVDFLFPLLTWPLPGVRFKDGAPAQVSASISGSLRGRMRTDGSLDLVLAGNRTAGVGPSGSRAAAVLGDGGRKIVRVRSGETVGLVLPAPRGYSMASLDGVSASTSSQDPGAGVPADGVSVSGESVTVSFGRFFTGHKMSLVLTARQTG